MLDRRTDKLTRAARRAADRERQRRHRAREALGLKPYQIETDEHELALALILSKSLTAEQTLDRELVQQALSKIVNEFCKNWLEDVTE